MSSRSREAGAPRADACVFDVDALACGELAPTEQARARAHVAECPRCREEYADRAREFRVFARRAHDAVDGRALPDVDALLLRAARQPAGLVVRARPFVARWFAAPVVGALALVAVIQARRERAFEPAPRPRGDGGAARPQDRAVIDGESATIGALPTSVDPCDVDASSTQAGCACTAAAHASFLERVGACAEPVSALSAPPVVCASTRDASFYFASDVDAVCAADAI